MVEYLKVICQLNFLGFGCQWGSLEASLFVNEIKHLSISLKVELWHVPWSANEAADNLTTEGSQDGNDNRFSLL